MAEFDSCEFQVVKDFDLRERHKGDLQGLSHLEIAKTNPISYKALMSKNEEQEIPVSTMNTHNYEYLFIRRMIHK